MQFAAAGTVTSGSGFHGDVSMLACLGLPQKGARWLPAELPNLTN
jgi:hypothetical protein